MGEEGVMALSREYCSTLRFVFRQVPAKFLPPPADTPPKDQMFLTVAKREGG
jgi:hypothetical protein